MQQKTIHEIVVDLCPSCGGVWLDKGEIGRLRKLQPTEILDFETPVPERLPPRAHNPVCPVCAKPLHPFKYAGGKVELETCENLDGLWIEDSELEQIAALAIPPVEARVVALQHEADSREGALHVSRATDYLKAMDHHYGWPIFFRVPQLP
jgi:Zn-finger nucleic acid-binding protein